MRHFRLIAAIFACLLWANAAFASQATLATPGSPLSMAGLASFLNNALLSIGSCNSGNSAPSNGPSSAAFAGECWINTTSNPWVFSYTADGTHWSQFGSLNTSTFAWTPYSNGFGGVLGGTFTTTGGLQINPGITGTFPTWTAGVLAGAAFETITNSAAPSTPSSANLSIWTDSSDKRLHDINDAGTIGTTVVKDTGTSHNFLTAIAANGIISKAQPVVGDLGNVNGGTILSNNTNASGPVVAATQPGLATSAAPSNPSSGFSTFWFDTTDLRFHDKNSSGAIGTTVVSDTGASNNFLTAIAANGAISKAQPSFGNLSGSAGCSQLPALTGDVTSAGGTCTDTIAANAVTNGKMAPMAANTVKGNATGSSATPTDVAPATARSSSLLNIDEATSTGDANYTILSTDRTVYHTALTAARTDTLPAANSVNAGQILFVADLRGVATASNTITLTRAGADTVNGGSTFLSVNSAYGIVACISDGSSRWNCQQVAGGGGGGGGVTNATIVAAGGLTSTGTCTITTTGTCTLYTPGGFLNKFRNGIFAAWFRGTSALATSTSGAYTADGWRVKQTGATFTCAQDTGINGALFSLKCVGGSSNTDTVFSQRIESYVAAPLAGATVTVQFQFKQDTGGAITPKVSSCYASATDNFTTCTADLAATSVSSCVSSSWCTESYTFTASSNATQGYEIDFDCNTALTSSQHCWISAADVRVTPGVTTGVNSNPPPVEYRIITNELAFNARYFQSSFGNGVTPGTATHVGIVGGISSSNGTTAEGISITYPVPMRAAGTLLSWDGNGNSSKASIRQSVAWIDNQTSGAVGTPGNGTTGFVMDGTTSAISTFIQFTSSAEL